MKSILIPTIVSTCLAIAIVNSAGAQSSDITASKVYKAGKGMLAYAFDHNDTLPLAFPRDESGAYRWNRAERVPDLYNIDSQIWANSVRPYWGLDALALAGPTYPINGNILEGSSIGIVMNGLLHTMSPNSIEKKELVPLMWTPYGKQNMYGTMATPSLACMTNIEPCVFGKPMLAGVHFVGPRPIEPFEGKLYVVTVDLSIRKPKVSAPLNEWKSGIYVDNSNGSYAATMPKDGSGNYPTYFAPNRTE